MNSISFIDIIAPALYFIVLVIYVSLVMMNSKYKLVRMLLAKLQRGIIVLLILEMFYFTFAASPISEHSIFARDRFLSFCVMIYFMASYFALLLPKDDKKNNKTQVNQEDSKKTMDKN